MLSKKQTYDTCTQLSGAVDRSGSQSLGLSDFSVFPAPLYHEGNSTQMTMMMKRSSLLFLGYLFSKYVGIIRDTDLESRGNKPSYRLSKSPWIPVKKRPGMTEGAGATGDDGGGVRG